MSKIGCVKYASFPKCGHNYSCNNNFDSDFEHAYVKIVVLYVKIVVLYVIYGYNKKLTMCK